jgi:hypothetical protein
MRFPLELFIVPFLLSPPGAPVVAKDCPYIGIDWFYGRLKGFIGDYY